MCGNRDNDPRSAVAIGLLSHHTQPWHLAMMRGRHRARGDQINKYAPSVGLENAGGNPEHRREQTAELPD
jgi:hypothetical protein